MNNIKNNVFMAANIFCLDEKSSPEVEKKKLGAQLARPKAFQVNHILYKS